MEEKDMLEAKAKKINYARTENLVMPILKNFEERLDSNVRARFGYLPYRVNMASNIDGECVEIAARRLMSRPASRHVMIVLSDGEPAGHGYYGDGGNPYTLGTLREDLRSRVENLSKYIDIVGIGIESHAVKAYYPKHVVLDSMTDLPGTVIKELRALLVPR
jgi:cobalamin biosynthesis protein CobT